MRPGSLLTGIFLTIFVGISSGYADTQKEKEQSLFLVARREMSDPLFKESVVLMVPSPDPDVVAGLIVNKQTHIVLGEVFPKDKELKERTDPVYFGGPVDIESISAVFLSSEVLPKAVHVAGDLYYSFDPDFIEGILKKPKQIKDVRLFLGRSGWAPEQLQDEMLGQAWYSEHEDDDWIFNRKPENCWPAMINQADPGDIVQLGGRSVPVAAAAGSRERSMGSVMSLENLDSPVSVRDPSPRVPATKATPSWVSVKLAKFAKQKLVAAEANSVLAF